MLPAINGIVAGKRKADFGSKERKPDRRAPGGSCLIATRRNSPNQAVASVHIHGGSRPEQGSGSRISSESSTPRWRSAAGFPRLLTKLERVGLAGRDLAQVEQELDPARVLVRCQSRLHVGLHLLSERRAASGCSRASGSSLSRSLGCAPTLVMPFL